MKLGTLRISQPWLAVVGGLAFTLGFAPFFIWPLALIGLAVVFFLLRQFRGLKLIFLWGMVHYVSSLYWVPRSFMVDAGGNWWPALYAGIPALLLICSILSGYLVLLAWLVRKLPLKLHAPCFILGWVVIEWLRTLQPLQFPWNPAGAIWAGHEIFLQGAALGGVWGLSFFTLVIAALLSYGSADKKRLSLAFLLVLSLMSFGTFRLATAPAIPFTDTTFRLVQPNLPTAHTWDEEARAKHLENVIALMDTANSPEIDAYIWPETAVAYAVQENYLLRQRLASLLRPEQKIILGFMRWERPRGAPIQYFNSMAVLNKDASLSSIYDKHILVPFGESLPWVKVTQKVLRTLSFNRGTFWPGESPAHMTINTVNALPLICYEGAFSNFVQQEFTNQQVLLNITNDNWFDGTTSPAQHFAVARMRAVETGLPMARVGNTGVTALVDGYGRILSSLPAQTQGVLDIRLPQPISPPIYHWLWTSIKSTTFDL